MKSVLYDLVDTDNSKKTTEIHAVVSSSYYHTDSEPLNREVVRTSVQAYQGSRCKDDSPLTTKFPFSETSNLLVAGMRCTSN